VPAHLGQPAHRDALLNGGRAGLALARDDRLASLTGASLTGASLTGASLTGASLTRASRSCAGLAGRSGTGC
jgi:uncharacterized protein YjbI with pentapeptide repeats